MTDKKYIVLDLGGHGDNHDNYISFKTKKEIVEKYFDDFPLKIFSTLPNIGYDSGILIIDGTIVVPKPKEKVTEWEF